MTDNGPHQFEMEEWISCAPFEQLLQMHIVEAQAGKAVLTMPFIRDLAQGAGLLHGGALMSLADTAVVMAIKSIVASRTHFATISCQTQFLYPVRKGSVTARAQVTAQDGRILHGQAVIQDEEMREVMRFHSTFKIAADTQIRGVSFLDSM
jgi:uncharacterized protein (TIGR00369 family)